MKILSVASARPNFVKLAAVHHALAKKKDVQHVIVHTGQHYDPLLSDVFFEQLNIAAPKYNLGIKGGSRREAVIAETANAFEEVIKKEKPDVVLVYGDVNGAVGAARAAKNAGIRIGHVEAGLRSFDKEMPEELNRIEIDQIADLLFTTEESANQNIRREGLPGTVHFVGNTMIDTLLRLLPTIEALPAQYALGSYIVSTIHRPANTDAPAVLQNILTFLASLPSTVVLPLHPRTHAAIQQHGIVVSSSIVVIDPLGYIEFLRLCQGATCILTDSGGIQEEAVLLQKKCFTLRRNTERPSTIASGSNELIDPTDLDDRVRVLRFFEEPIVNVTVPPLWDGKAGERIASLLSCIC